jgi:hypothetical protein
VLSHITDDHFACRSGRDRHATETTNFTVFPSLIFLLNATEGANRVYHNGGLLSNDRDREGL